MVLNQRVVVSPWSPTIDQHLTVTTVLCPDCRHRFQAEAELAIGQEGLADPASTVVRLLDHARSSPRPHPTLLGETAPIQRSA